MFDDIFDDEMDEKLMEFFQNQLDTLENHELMSAIIATVGVEGYKKVLELAIESLKK